MVPLANEYYGSEQALRIQVGCLCDHLRLVIEASRSTVSEEHTAALENCFDILYSVLTELEQSETPDSQGE